MLRRSFLTLAGATLAGGAAVAVSGCSKSVDANGNTTYALDVDKFNAIFSPLFSGAEQFVDSGAVLGVLSEAEKTAADNAITKLQTLQTTITTNLGKTVSFTVGNSWLVTAEDAVNVLAGIATAESSLLPANATTVLNAVVSLLPALEALINVAVGAKLHQDYIPAPRHLVGKEQLSVDQAKEIISSHLLAD